MKLNDTRQIQITPNCLLKEVAYYSVEDALNKNAIVVAYSPLQLVIKPDQKIK